MKPKVQIATLTEQEEAHETAIARNKHIDSTPMYGDPPGLFCDGGKFTGNFFDYRAMRHDYANTTFTNCQFGAGRVRKVEFRNCVFNNCLFLNSSSQLDGEAIRFTNCTFNNEVN